MPIAVMRLVAARHGPPVYCDVAIRDDPTLGAHFQTEPNPRRFTMSARLHRPEPVFTQCCSCARWVFRLVEEADVIERVHTALRAGESTRGLHLALQAQPSWLFHGHPSALPTALASAVRDTRYEVKPIRVCVQSISAIPTPEAIVRAVRASIRHLATDDDARGIPGEMWEPIEPLELPSPI